MQNERLTNLTTEIVTAFVSANQIEPGEMPDLIKGVYGALNGLGQVEVLETVFVPAVNPKRSVKPDAIISLIDGKPYKMLKRHLMLNGLTPEVYRDRYGLPADYPMVAPNYSEKRRDLAKKIGLGRKPGAISQEA